MKVFVKKIIQKIFAFANKDVFLRIDSLHNCFREGQTELCNQFAEEAEEIRKQNEEVLTKISEIATSEVKAKFVEEAEKIRKQNGEALTKISEIAMSSFQIQATLNLLEKNQKILEKRQCISEVQSHYRYVRAQILTRISQGEKLRFGSYVVYDTTFGAHEICELMLKEPEKYDVKFVICPDTYRDMDGLKQYHKTKQFFIERYGADKVLDGYDEKNGEFLDWSDKFDVVYTANKYDVLVNKVHGIQYLCKQDLLPIFISYGFNVTNWAHGSDENVRLSCLYWKYFVSTPQTKLNMTDEQIAPAFNIVVSGYPKMDSLAFCDCKETQKKTILLAPHHTVKGLPGKLQLSNFLEYADLIPKLADMFPNIDFIFRPHPLLFTNLKMHGIWSEGKVSQYLELLKSKNIVYSTEGDYFHLFKECDAIIHDCGSYLAEWLFTGKPCCYVIESEEAITSQLNKDGLLCLKKHELADSEQKIINFIKKIENSDYEIKVSDEIRNKIMVNYPNSNEFIFKNFLNFADSLVTSRKLEGGGQNYSIHSDKFQTAGGTL